MFLVQPTANYIHQLYQPLAHPLLFTHIDSMPLSTYPRSTPVNLRAYIYYFVPNGRFFSGILHFSRLAAGCVSCFLLRGPQWGGVDSTLRALDPAGLRGPCSTWSMSREPANNSGDRWCPPFEKPSRGLKNYQDFGLFRYQDLFFSLLGAYATAAHRAARVRDARAHHALEVRSSKTTTTAGVRVLLESSIARVPLCAAAAAVSAAAECSCARDCLATPCSCLSRARCA